MRLIYIWWNVDRVRIPRSDGRLLRVQIGQHLLIHGKPFHIVGREHSTPGSEIRICLAMREQTIVDGPLWYLVGQWGSSGGLASRPVTWCLNSPTGDSNEIEADDIVCFMNNSN